MKQAVLLSVFAISLSYGCGGDIANDLAGDSAIVADSIAAVEANQRAAQDTINNDTIAAAQDTTPAEPVYDAFFEVWYTTSYCGGARPTDEIVAENAKEKPLTNSQIKLKNHFSGKEYILKTSPDGETRGKMEAGKYDVFLTKDINANLGTGFDSKCDLWTKQLQMTVKVDESEKMNKILIHFICNPCDETMKRRQ